MATHWGQRNRLGHPSNHHPPPTRQPGKLSALLTFPATGPGKSRGRMRTEKRPRTGGYHKRAQRSGRGLTKEQVRNWTRVQRGERNMRSQRWAKNFRAGERQRQTCRKAERGAGVVSAHVCAAHLPPLSLTVQVELTFQPAFRGWKYRRPAPGACSQHFQPVTELLGDKYLCPRDSSMVGLRDTSTLSSITHRQLLKCLPWRPCLHPPASLISIDSVLPL